MPAPTPADKPVSPTTWSVVLVHGAFVDGSGWRGVYDRLSAAGFEVLIVQNPTITLEGDAAEVHRVIAQAKHPVILVGHSYGGAVITVAGDHPAVRRLIYLAAFAPDVGESVFALATAPVPDFRGPPLLPPSDGVMRVDPDAFPAAFAADVDPGLSRFMAAAQVPWGLSAVQAEIPHAAWKAKPVHYLVATQDQMIAPTAQRAMARRAEAATAEVDSSHAVMLSHPDVVADFIARAANSAAPQLGALETPEARTPAANPHA